VTLRRGTPGLHMTIAVRVAGCSVNGAWVGLEASRDLLALILRHDAGARTGKDSADFFWSMHLAPFIQIEVLALVYHSAPGLRFGLPERPAGETIEQEQRDFILLVDIRAECNRRPWCSL
jgi:hypothetical protein